MFVFSPTRFFSRLRRSCRAVVLDVVAAACRAMVLGSLAISAGSAQEGQSVSTEGIVRFLTASGSDHRLLVSGVRARILARELGSRASGPLTELLSQPITASSAPILVRALEAAWYAPIDVPESVLLRYAVLRADAVPGVSPLIIGDLRSRALVALAWRPRPDFEDFWMDLWVSEQDPLYQQWALVGMACANPEAVRPMLAQTSHNRLLSEIAERLRAKLADGDSARVCAGGESTRTAALSSPPSLPTDMEEQGRVMLRRAGIAR
jgi:hypothetical protein